MSNLINRFLFHVQNAFHPELPTPKREKCVYVHRDFNIIVARMLELPGNFIIREQEWADGKNQFLFNSINLKIKRSLPHDRLTNFKSIKNEQRQN